MTIKLTSMMALVIIVHQTCGPALATDTKADSNANSLHGPIGYLQQSLIQSAEETRLLGSARSGFESGDLDVAFTALRLVLQQDHDAFTTIYPNQASAGTYRTAFELLRRSGYQTLATWTTTTEPIARPALQQAMTDGDSIALMRVARSFPFTESGLKASAACIRMALSRGQVSLASSMLAEANDTYGGTPVSFSSKPILDELRQRVQAASPIGRSARITGSATAKPAQLTLPWAKPIWQWEESVWEHAQVGSIFGGVTLPENWSVLAANKWRPVLIDDTIITRTPSRIICFSKATGQVQWSLATDTLTEVSQSMESSQRTSTFSRASVFDLIRMDEFGTMAASGDTLIFVDHFRQFRGKRAQASTRFGVFPQVRRPTPHAQDQNAGGRRLVCVQTQPHPRILWTLGTTPDTAYRFQDVGAGAPSTDQDEDDSSETRATDEGVFLKHSFLGVPLLHDQLAFVLSADQEVAWLNCITLATGRVLWQKPLMYQQTAAERTLRNRYGASNLERALGASICGIDGDVLLCVMKHGVVIGTHITDGRLLWATNLKDPENSNGFSRYLPNELQSDATGMSPVITNGRLIWASPHSSTVQCIDSQTGTVVWKVSRSAEGGGSVEGSIDRDIVTTDDQRVVTTGDRHVRSLSLEDGQQQWVTRIQPLAGRACSAGNHCLFVEQNGTASLLDTETGARTVTSRALPAGDVAAAGGTLTTDGKIICATTPTSIQVLPMAFDQKSANAVSDEFVKAKQQLMAGKLTESTAMLRQLSADDSDTQGSAQQLLTQLLLDDKATRRFRLPDFNRPHRSGAEPLPEDASLKPDQQLRRQLLVADRVVLPDSSATGDPPLVQVTSAWRARLDVAARAQLNSDVADRVLRPLHPMSVSLADVEQAILFPAQVGTVQQQAEFAQKLINQRMHTAAELFLVAAITSADQKDTAVLLELQTELRRCGREPRGTQTVLSDDTEFDVELPELARGKEIGDVLSAASAIVTTPQWFRDRLVSLGRRFHTINMDTGAVSVPRQLPGPVDVNDVSLRSDAPGLIPIAVGDRVGLLSLVDPVHPQVIWWRRIPRHVSDRRTLQVGPVSPSSMMVATRSHVYSLHPLTGSILWSQELAMSNQARHLFRRAEELFGDDQTIGVFGQKTNSCTVFRTLDGRAQGVVSLDIPASQIPLVSGRNLLYLKDNELALVDLATGTDKLNGREPLQILGNGRAQLLSHDRAAVISAQGHFQTVYMKTGDVLTDTPLGAKLNRDDLAGISVVERDDRFYVVTKINVMSLQRFTASSRFREPRLDSGTLHCIDAQTGKLLWQRESFPSIMPQVYGDDINLLILWAWDQPDSVPGQPFGVPRLNLRSGRQERSVRLTFVNADTGKTMAEHAKLCFTEPLRCVHDADHKTVQIETERSVITLKYGQ